MIKLNDFQQSYKYWTKNKHKIMKVYICKQFSAKTNMHTLWYTDVAVINPDSQTSRKKNLWQKILIDKICEQIL